MKDILLKIEFVLMFVDLKVMLLAWMLIDLYRNTMLVDNLNGHTSARIADTMSFVWSNAGSGYIVWIPIVAVADILIKNTIRKLI